MEMFVVLYMFHGDILLLSKTELINTALKPFNLEVHGVWCLQSLNISDVMQ